MDKRSAEYKEHLRHHNVDVRKAMTGEQFEEWYRVWFVDGESEADELERLRDMRDRILRWCDAYPLSVFPEPDMGLAAKLLRDGGLTLDAVSASNMRHVLKGVREIIES